MAKPTYSVYTIAVELDDGNKLVLGETWDDKLIKDAIRDIVGNGIMYNVSDK